MLEEMISKAAVVDEIMCRIGFAELGARTAVEAAKRSEEQCYYGELAEVLGEGIGFSYACSSLKGLLRVVKSMQGESK